MAISSIRISKPQGESMHHKTIVDEPAGERLPIEELHKRRLRALQDDAFAAAERVKKLQKDLKLAKSLFDDAMDAHEAAKNQGPTMFDGEDD